jgi:hypothetical protein
MFSCASLGNINTSNSLHNNANQWRWRLFLFVCLPSWIFYLTLLSPTITEGGDCGELVAASYHLSIAHPSGYAIWSLLGRVFALLPLGEIGWRYNAFSSICGAISAGILALACFEILVSPRFSQSSKLPSAFWASLSCGLLFAGFYYAVSQFVIAEVYSLASLWGALLLWLALRWHFGNDWRDAFSLAFCAGLAPLIHLSTIFLLPWIFIFAIWKKQFTPAKITISSGLFLLGLTCICYFPIRSAQFPALPEKNVKALAFYPLDWSHPTDLSQLKNHVTAAQYRNLLIETYQANENGKIVTRKRLAQPVSEVPRRLSELLGFIPMQFLWATPLILLGAFKSFKIRRVGWLLLLILLGNIGTQINYKVPDQTNFFFPAYLTTGIWMGIGWFSVFEWAFKRENLLSRAAPLFLLMTVFCQWSIVGMTLGSGGRTINRDIGIAEANAAQKLAKNTGKTAFIFFGSDDSMWRFWYTKYVLDKAPQVETPWGRRHYSRRTNGQWVQDVALRKRDGLVLMAEWDAKTDQRFPYVPIENTGLVWLASDNPLPNPATITGQSAQQGEFVKAKIRRNSLWKRPSNSDAHLLPGILVALDLEFALPENWKTELASNSYSPTIGGEIEFKVGKKGDVQRRRLVLPTNWKAGQVLKITVPLDINIETKVGRYGLWTRLTNTPFSDRATEWIETDFLRVGKN